MKKLFLISMAATALLASCSNDETVEMAQNNNVISFASFVDKSTKAAQDVTLANLGSIEVYGWRGDTQIFNKQAVTVDAQGNGTYTPLQYWDGGYTYSFEAIAPKNEEKGVTFTAAKTGGTIDFTSDAETDLLYAGVVTKTTASTISSDPGKVSFTFGHMLSRVKFTFVNGFPSNAAAKISVSNVKISAVHKSGSITPAASNSTWTLGTETMDVTFSSTDVANLIPEVTPLPENEKCSAATEHKYLIPVTSPSYKVSFTVTMDQNGAQSTYNHTNVAISTTLEKGKSYNFIAKLTADNIDPAGQKYPIEFAASISDWVSAGDEYILGGDDNTDKE